MQHHSILLIEDDIEFAQFVVSILTKEGFEAVTVPTGADMFKEIDSRNFDCYVVDLTLPDEDGIVLIRKLRARSSAPIVVLSGRTGIEDKLASFDLGAEDYITKPVDPRELVLRLNTILKRFGDAGAGDQDVLYCGGYVLDHNRHQAHDRHGQAVAFTPSEFSLIWVLAQANGKVLSRETLIDALSAVEGPSSDRAIDNLVSRVRKKLDKEAIETVSGAGYKCGWTVSKPA